MSAAELEPLLLESGNIEHCFLFGFIVRTGCRRIHFSIAAEGVQLAVTMALKYVELCIEMIISESHITTIVFFGRCDDDETLKTEEWFFRDLERRGSLPIKPLGN